MADITTITELQPPKGRDTVAGIADWLFSTSQNVVPLTAAVTSAALGSLTKAIRIATNVDIQFAIGVTATTASAFLGADQETRVAVNGGERLYVKLGGI